MSEPRETHILTPVENERIFRADIARTTCRAISRGRRGRR